MDEKRAKKRSKSDKNNKHKHLKMDGEKNLGSSFELEADRENRKKHKERRKNKHGSDKRFSSSEVLEENCTDKAAEGQTCLIEGDITFVRNGKEGSQTKRKKRKVGSSFELEADRAKRKKLKEKTKNKHGSDKEFDSSEVLEENCTDKAAEGQTCLIEGDIAFIRNDKEEESKTKRKKRKVGSDNDELVNKSVADENEMQPSDDNRETKKNKRKVLDNSCDETQEERASKQAKKSKRKEDRKFKSKNDATVNTGHTNAHSIVSEVDGEGRKMDIEKKKKKKIHTEFDNYASGREICNTVTDADHQSKKIEMKKKKKKEDTKLDKNASGKKVDNTVTSADKSADLALKGKSKRVTFADQVEVLNDDLVRGKRFTPEEDEKIKEAVFNYIESHRLGDNGLDMVLRCKSHRGMKNCWKEIGASLPHRPYVAVYYRAHILFERGEERKWTSEEYEFLRNFQEKHGSDWKTIAEALGKHRFHVKDAWRRIKLTNTNKGHWSQEEYQNLFDLVNVDLCMRAQEECRKSKYGMLRDNICWEAIGDKLLTRKGSDCCRKWYDQLTSPMVAEGIWTDTDDYRLLDALFTMDACCMEEVDWDNLLEHRAGDVCRKRWNQMVMQIGEHGNKSFAEQVEVLSKRYCPPLLEAREAFDSKPVVT